MPLTRLFPAARLESMNRYMKDFAARFGVHDMRTSDRIPNTRRALAIAELAREQGKLEPFREAVMDAHWRDGRDIEADEVLWELAAQAGLEPREALEAADAPGYLARIDTIRAEAEDMGVTGIPTFFFGERCVVGCQPYEVLAEVARKAGARPRGAGT